MTPDNYKKFKEWLKDRHLLYLRGSKTEGERLDDRWRNSIQASLLKDVLVVLEELENTK